MKKFWSNLTSYNKIAILSALLGGIAFVVALVLFFVGIAEFQIAIGVILSPALIAVSYVLQEKIGTIEDGNQKLKLSMIVSTTRLFMLVGLTILEVILERKLEFSLFNPFAFVGGYLVCSGISILILFLEKKKCE